MARQIGCARRAHQSSQRSHRISTKRHQSANSGHCRASSKRRTTASASGKPPECLPRFWAQSVPNFLGRSFAGQTRVSPNPRSSAIASANSATRRSNPTCEHHAQKGCVKGARSGLSGSGKKRTGDPCGELSVAGAGRDQFGRDIGLLLRAVLASGSIEGLGRGVVNYRNNRHANLKRLPRHLKKGGRINNRRPFLLGSVALVGAAVGGEGCLTGPALAQQRAPNMPARNPWLADGVYPTHVARADGGASDTTRLPAASERGSNRLRSRPRQVACGFRSGALRCRRPRRRVRGLRARGASARCADR